MRGTTLAIASAILMLTAASAFACPYKDQTASAGGQTVASSPSNGSGPSTPIPRKQAGNG